MRLSAKGSSYKLSHGYRTLPKRENRERDTAPKTKNARARARIMKVMSRLPKD
ncbi:MAG: hypothetical protein J6B24_02195 [Clostridia bacterium]|nr:hypothetical protein [Clostridia bacterium]